MKKTLCIILMLLAAGQFAFGGEPLATATVWPKDEGLSFFWVSDIGRNGYYQQRPVAQKMGELAEMVMPSFIVTSGDNFHYRGFESVNDPVWQSNFEDIYTHPDLHCPWYPALGNHEYGGNVQAVIDYSSVSRRWEMPARYYTKVFSLGRNYKEKLRLVVIDTTPIMAGGRPSSKLAVEGQDVDAQLAWLDEVLAGAEEKWVIVVGHHPIYDNNGYSGGKSDNQVMIDRVDPILRRHGVDFYLCGDSHTFQHIQRDGVQPEYIIHTSGSLARPVNDEGGSGGQVLFCSPKEGYAACAVTDDEFHLWLVDFMGYVTYEYAKKK